MFLHKIKNKIITRLRLKINYRLKAILKRCVLSLVLKESKVSEYLTKSGSLFQSLGDEHAKDLSPKVAEIENKKMRHYFRKGTKR